MTEAQRLALTGKLRQLLEQSGIVFENLSTDTPDRAILASVNELHDRAAELLARAVDALRPPGAYAFSGDLVVLGPERTEQEDREAQHYVERRAG